MMALGKVCRSGKHWKQFAKRLENGAFSPAEVTEALNAALLKDARELPVKEILRVLAPNGQGTLFTPELGRAIEALRQEHPGSKTAQTFLAYLSQQDASASPGRDIVESAVADTLRECLHDNSRSTQEHYLRKTRYPWDRVRGASRRLARASMFETWLRRSLTILVPQHCPTAPSSATDSTRVRSCDSAGNRRASSRGADRRVRA